MAAAGYATHHTGPHRFQITQAGIDAAGTLPPPTPRSPPAPAAAAARRQPVRAPTGSCTSRAAWPAPPTSTCCAGCGTSASRCCCTGRPAPARPPLVEAAFADLLTVAGTGDTVVEDFLGSYIPLPDGGYEFVYGPLVTAMRRGPAAAGRRRHPHPAPGPRRAVPGHGRPPGHHHPRLPQRTRRGRRRVLRHRRPQPRRARRDPHRSPRLPLRRAHRGHHRLGPRPPPRRARPGGRRRHRPQRPTWPPASSAGRRNCANCSASPASARPSATPPRSPTSPAAPPTTTAARSPPPWPTTSAPNHRPATLGKQR